MSVKCFDKRRENFHWTFSEFLNHNHHRYIIYTETIQTYFICLNYFHLKYMYFLNIFFFHFISIESKKHWEIRILLCWGKSWIWSNIQQFFFQLLCHIYFQTLTRLMWGKKLHNMAFLFPTDNFYFPLKKGFLEASIVCLVAWHRRQN